jgi:hypothetical protein
MLPLVQVCFLPRMSFWSCVYAFCRPLNTINMSPRNQAIWNLLILATMIIAATVTLMIFDRQDLSKHKKQVHAEAKLPTEEPKTDRDSVVAEPIVRASEPQVIAVSNDLPVSGDFILVAASFRNETHAENFLSDFKKKISWSTPKIITHSQNDTAYFRIVALHGTSWKNVSSNRDSLKAAGYSDAWIYKQQ